MAQSGSLQMTNAYSNGSMIMEEKVLLFDKSGYLFLYVLCSVESPITNLSKFLLVILCSPAAVMLWLRLT